MHVANMLCAVLFSAELEGVDGCTWYAANSSVERDGCMLPICCVLFFSRRSWRAWTGARGMQQTVLWSGMDACCQYVVCCSFLGGVGGRGRVHVVCSKQFCGAGWMHVANMLCAVLFSAELEGVDGCTW